MTSFSGSAADGAGNHRHYYQHRLQIVLLLLQRWYAAIHPEEVAAAGNHLVNRFLLLLEKHYAQYHEWPTMLQNCMLQPVT